MAIIVEVNRPRRYRARPAGARDRWDAVGIL